MKLGKRMITNLAANGYSQLCTVAAQLLMVPLFVHVYGTMMYGEWLVLSTVPAYLALSDSGFSTVATNEIAMCVARGDSSGARRTLHSLFALLLGISGSISIISWIMSLALPWDKVFSLHSIEVIEARKVVFWLGLYTCANILGNVFNATYRYDGRYARGIVMLNSLRLMEVGGTCACLSLGFGPGRLACALFLTRLVGISVIYLDSRGGKVLGLAGAAWPEIRRLFRPSFTFMAFGVGGGLYFQGTTVAVNAILGPSVVVMFTSVRTLTRLVSQAVSIVKNAAWPEFSSLIARGCINDAKMLNRLICEACLWTTIVACAGLLLTAQSILGMWTHGAVAVDIRTLSIFLIGVAVNGLWFVCTSAIMAVNRHQKLAICYIAAAALGIVSTYWMCLAWGKSAVAGGMLVAEVLVFPIALIECCRVVGDSPTALIRSAVLLSRTRVWLRANSRRANV